MSDSVGVPIGKMAESLLGVGIGKEDKRFGREAKEAREVSVPRKVIVDDDDDDDDASSKGKGIPWFLIISIAVLILVIGVGGFMAYKYWKRRQEEIAQMHSQTAEGGDDGPAEVHVHQAQSHPASSHPASSHPSPSQDQYRQAVQDQLRQHASGAPNQSALSRSLSAAPTHNQVPTHARTGHVHVTPAPQHHAKPADAEVAAITNPHMAQQVKAAQEARPQAPAAEARAAAAAEARAAAAAEARAAAAAEARAAAAAEARAAAAAEARAAAARQQAARLEEATESKEAPAAIKEAEQGADDATVSE